MKKRYKIEPSLLILSLVGLLLIVIAWRRGGTEMVIAGFYSGGSSLIQIVPLLIAAFITAGLIQVTSS